MTAANTYLPSDPNPDRKALAFAGGVVRARLDADPQAYRVETDQAEIYAFADFLDPVECEEMIALIDKDARPSTLYDHGLGPSHRTSYSCDVDRDFHLVQMIERRISDCLGLAPDCGETMQGQRYLPGQEFRPHYDWFWTRAKYWKDERRRGGQRCWTTMIYLNAVEEGGETAFSRIGLSIPPQRGVLLAWNNATPEGRPNMAVLHAGTPVTRGVKHIITKWYRTRAWG